MLLKRAEKEKILAKLREQFGIEELNYLLIKQGKERIRAFSGSLSREELEKLGESVNIETLGTYLGDTLWRKKVLIIKSKICPNSN